MGSAGIIISSQGEEILQHLQANTKIPQIAERGAESRMYASKIFQFIPGSRGSGRVRGFLLK
jgi:hypothetical protein